MMNAMGYDACTIGNHEFDFGLENMARLFAMADFPVVCANYDFTGTACEGLVKPYVVIRKGGRRIGVFGLSPALQGLVAKENYAGVRFISPLLAAKDAVDALKTQGCDTIICLSHIGWQMPGEYNDEILATSTSGIDVILGGHSQPHAQPVLMSYLFYTVCHHNPFHLFQKLHWKITAIKSKSISVITSLSFFQRTMSISNYFHGDFWRRQWQPIPVVLPRKFHGQRSLAGYSPWRWQRVRHD